MKYVLVIFLYGGTDGGRTINSDLLYTSLQSCEVARAAINATKFDTNWRPTVICLQADMVAR